MRKNMMLINACNNMNGLIQGYYAVKIEWVCLRNIFMNEDLDKNYTDLQVT